MPSTIIDFLFNDLFHIVIASHAKCMETAEQTEALPIPP